MPSWAGSKWFHGHWNPQFKFSPIWYPCLNKSSLRLCNFTILPDLSLFINFLFSSPFPKKSGKDSNAFFLCVRRSPTKKKEEEEGSKWTVTLFIPGGMLWLFGIWSFFHDNITPAPSSKCLLFYFIRLKPSIISFNILPSKFSLPKSSLPFSSTPIQP